MLSLYIIMLNTFATIANVARIRTGHIPKNNVNTSIIFWLWLCSESIRFESRPRNYPGFYVYISSSRQTPGWYLQVPTVTSYILPYSTVYDHIFISHDGALAWLPFQKECIDYVLASFLSHRKCQVLFLLFVAVQPLW